MMGIGVQQLWKCRECLFDKCIWHVLVFGMTNFEAGCMFPMGLKFTHRSLNFGRLHAFRNKG